MVVIMVSIADSPSLEPMCMGEIAPVWVAAAATRCAKNFLRVNLGHESKDIGLMLAG